MWWCSEGVVEFWAEKEGAGIKGTCLGITRVENAAAALCAVALRRFWLGVGGGGEDASIISHTLNENFISYVGKKETKFTLDACCSRVCNLSTTTKTTFYCVYTFFRLLSFQKRRPPNEIYSDLFRLIGFYDSDW